jgi:hypothetical protein
MIILGTNSIKDTGYNVDNSLRLDSASTAYLSRTVNLTQNSTSQHKFTISCWFKLGKTGQSNGELFGAHGSNDYFTVRVQNGNKIDILSYDNAIKGRLVTTQVLRDHSSWYHIVAACDSNNASGTNRMRLYLNGSEVTDFSTDTHPSSGTDLIAENMDSFNIGRSVDQVGGAGLFDGYIAEFVYIDNDQLEPSYFGEFDEDTGIWKPKDLSELSQLSNTFSFYLDFEDSSALGNDVSGNDNDFSVNNLTAIDQSTDTCTNNFCTLNPLDGNLGDSLFTEGNLKFDTNTGSNKPWSRSTIGVSSGKWYFEAKLITVANNQAIGISDRPSPDHNSTELGAGAFDYSYQSANNGDKYNNGSQSSYGNTYGANDIVSCALDLDNLKVYFGKNGTFQNSGDPTNGTNPAFTITAPSLTNHGFYFFCLADLTGTNKSVWEANFGSPSYAISSGNSDGNGYGNFEYAVPSGYFSLNTKNLAEYG